MWTVLDNYKVVKEFQTKSEAYKFIYNENTFITPRLLHNAKFDNLIDNSIRDAICEIIDDMANKYEFITKNLGKYKENVLRQMLFLSRNVTYTSRLKVAECVGYLRMIRKICEDLYPCWDIEIDNVLKKIAEKADSIFTMILLMYGGE